MRQFAFFQKKFEKQFESCIDLIKKHNVMATFAINADVVQKNNRYLRNMNGNNVEIAINGYKHEDYGELDFPEHLNHFEKAINVFDDLKIGYEGFRSPNLRYNDNTFHVLNLYSFLWDSSATICWEVVNNYNFNFSRYLHYIQTLNRYKSRTADRYLSLPKFIDNLVEIPVSLPGDDLLTGQLGIKDKQLLSKIYVDILNLSYKRGELYTVQLHPERIRFYSQAINDLIQRAHRLRPQIWVAPLGNIAKWWLEKNGFSMNIHKIGANKYKVQVNCTDRALVLLKMKKSGHRGFFKKYYRIKERNFILTSPTLPIVGVPEKCSPKLIHFLKNEGIIFGRISDQHQYSVYLTEFPYFYEKDEMNVLQKIDRSQNPLLRFWRWPAGFRSALAITGEFDPPPAVNFNRGQSVDSI